MIIVQISDAREQYVKSAIDSSALPVGARVPLRYDTRWVASDIVKAVQRGDQLDDLMLCHLSGNTGNLEHARSVPIRLASVMSAEVKGAFVVIEARAGEFLEADFIRAVADGPIAGAVLERPREGAFVYHATTDIEGAAATDPDLVRGWQQAVEVLGGSESMEAVHFCLLEGVRGLDGAFVPFDASCALSLQSDCDYNVPLHSVSLRSSVGGKTAIVTLTVDQEVYSLRDTPDFQLGRRFDSRQVGIKSKATDRKVEGSIVLASSDPLMPHVSLRGVVHPKPFSAILRRVPLGLGAAIAASPATMPDDWPLWAKLTPLIVGSIIVAVSGG